MHSSAHWLGCRIPRGAFWMCAVNTFPAPIHTYNRMTRATAHAGLSSHKGGNAVEEYLGPPYNTLKGTTPHSTVRAFPSRLKPSMEVPPRWEHGAGLWHGATCGGFHSSGRGKIGARDTESIVQESGPTSSNFFTHQRFPAGGCCGEGRPASGRVKWIPSQLHECHVGDVG